MFQQVTGSCDMPPSTKEGTATDLSQTAVAQRRARNRVSQKSFRERQTLYVRQLESRLADYSRNEDVRIQTLQDECERTRAALLAARKRVLGLNTALAGVAEKIGESLGLAGNGSADGDDVGPQNASEDDLDVAIGHVANRSVGDHQGAHNPPTNAQQPALRVGLHAPTAPGLQREVVQTMPTHGMLCASAAGFQLPHHSGYLSVDSACMPFLDVDSFMPGLWEPFLEDNGGQVDAVDSGSYPLGAHMDPSRALHTAEHDRMALYHDHEHTGQVDLNGPPARMTPGLKLFFPPGSTYFPSTFCAHLAACEFFIQQNRAYKQRHLPSESQALSKLISKAVNMFISTAWPDMRIWMTYMQSPAGIEKIIRWRLDPTLESYQALIPCHRPTTTQLCTPHPPMIDWLYFPALRDRLIKTHASSPDLDQLLCEHVRLLVVEADLSEIVIGLGDDAPKKGYFRIWDLVQTISNEESGLLGYSDSQWPAFWQDGGQWGPTGENLPSPFQVDDGEDEAGQAGWNPMLLEDIFRSKKAASKLLKLLNIDDHQRDLNRVKLDPTFAVNHPDLCDDPSIFASGVDCTRRAGVATVPPPRPLTREAILNYKLMLGKTVVA